MRWTQQAQNFPAHPFVRPANNLHVLTVGPEESGIPGLNRGGFPLDFTSIGAAMDSIPLYNPELKPEDPEYHNPSERWTILVTTGNYIEEIRCKPYVNIVGLNKESVYIEPPARALRGEPPAGHSGLANVYLSPFSLLTNVTLGNPADSMPGDVVVSGFDTFHGLGGDVHDLGLANVDILPFSRYPPDAVDGVYSKASLIRMDGYWHTAIFRDVGGNYIAPNGNGIELIGRFQVADCHFTNCFFDALYLTVPGGCVANIQDCYDVHFRNSFIRINNMTAVKDAIGVGRAIAISTSNPEKPATVFIEGCTLACDTPQNRGVVDVGTGAVCFFRHSSARSVSGAGAFVATSRADGIG